MFLFNYQGCLSKYVILGPLKTKTATEEADYLVSIFIQHGLPSILHRDNGTEFSNKKLMTRIDELWKGTNIVHGCPHLPQEQRSVKRANEDFQEHALRPTQRYGDGVQSVGQWITSCTVS